MAKKESLIHYWEFPKNLFINLKKEQHKELCKKTQIKLNNSFKNCFHLILNCSKWHAQRLFTKYTRMTIEELEKLREFTEIPKEEIEQNIETIGNHEGGAVIRNPKLPFNLKDIVYVASHLMFDGSYRDKKGCYFYSYEKELTEYHLKRLSKFGEVPNNFIEKENQLYFSYTIAYITSRILDIYNFDSLDVFLSEKFKKLVKENKELLDEFIKAMIIDEGEVQDIIRIELGNERLIQDIYEVISIYYKLTKITLRIRDHSFKNNSKWTYKNVPSWNIVFSSNSVEELYKRINPLPISYKQQNFELLYKRRTREWYKRKPKETKELIIRSLLEKPKSVLALALELEVRNTTIRAHLNGHPSYNKSLIDLGIANKVSEEMLRKGGYAKADIFGIVDIKKAEEFLKK